MISLYVPSSISDVCSDEEGSKLLAYEYNDKKGSEILKEENMEKKSTVLSQTVMTKLETALRDCALRSIAKAVENNCIAENWKFSYEQLHTRLKDRYCEEWIKFVKRHKYEGPNPLPNNMPRCECVNSTCELDNKIKEHTKDFIRQCQHFKMPGCEIGYQPLLFDGSQVYGTLPSQPQLITIKVRHEWHKKFDEYIEKNCFVLEKAQNSFDNDNLVRHCFYVQTKEDNNDTYHCEDLQQTNLKARYPKIIHDESCWLWMVSLEEWDLRGGDFEREDLPP